jgi:hypothetical protein
MTTYTRETHGRRDGNPSCTHCGQVARQHHSTGRCYTPEEVRARRDFARRHGRFPAQDEGCAPRWWRWLLVGAAVGGACLVVAVLYGWLVWHLMGQ